MSNQAKKLMPAGHRIALYVRVSTEEQAENPEGSIKNQEERLRATVKLKNMDGIFGEIKSVYIDRAKSGKDTNRPELQRLLLAIRKREVDLVMVTELSRISRSIKDFSEIWEMMQEHGCGFQSLRENFDTTTAAGEMVLFTVANIAQFERRQISERVAANFNARAQRGLFNGGSIPFGYTRIEDKPGYLAVDEEAAVIVREAFRAFIREGYLMGAARSLNEHGYRLKRAREGGGIRSRMGIFTIDNLQAILRNKFYLGIKTFKHRGEQKETEAVWPPIVDPDVFEEANKLLDKNKSTNKTRMKDRYPYILSGLVTCKNCGDRLVGKSAHGKREKIGYYEHAWATKKGSHIPGLKHKCHGKRRYRVLAKELEEVVWQGVADLLKRDEVAREILAESQKSHRRDPGSKDSEKCRQTIFSVDQQLETLAERLASMPSTISPTPKFAQMEKLEGLKRQAQTKLSTLQSLGATTDEPIELKDYQLFLGSLNDLLNSGESAKLKTFIIRALVKEIHYTPEAVHVNFLTARTYVKKFLERELQIPFDELSPDSGQKNRADGQTVSPISTLRHPPKKNGVGCSNTLIIGRRDWI